MKHKLDNYFHNLLSIANSENLQVYLVGGSVRDQVMGRHCDDFDFTSDNAPRLTQLLSDSLNLSLIKLDDTPNRETLRVIINKYCHFDFSAMQGGTIESDLAQRDFTINSMAISLHNFINNKHILIDLHDGQNDIKNKIVRALPGSTFESDPLRMLRAYRFAAKLNFSIETNTQRKIEKLCSKIQQIAKERITHELLTYFDAKTPEQQPLIFSGLLENIFPDIKSWEQISSSNKTFSNLEINISKPEIIYKEYCQDIKTYLKSENHKALLLFSGIFCSKDFENDQTSSGDSKNKSLRIKTILSQLRMSNSEISFIERTLLFHQQAISNLGNLFSEGKNLRGIYNFVKSAGNELISASLLASAKYLSNAGDSVQFNNFLYETYDFYAKWYLPSLNSQALINGDDLTNIFNLKPSPLYKTILDNIEEERVLKIITTREQAESRVKSMILEYQQG